MAGGSFGDIHLNFCIRNPFFVAVKQHLHWDRVRRLTTAHPHPTGLSPAQPRFLAITPEPVTWQRLGCPRPCRDLSSSLDVAGHPAVEQESVTVCSRLGPGTQPSLPPCQHVPLRPRLLGALPREAQGASAARRRGGRRSLLCQNICPAQAPHGPGKLCQTFLPAPSAPAEPSSKTA